MPVTNVAGGVQQAQQLINQVQKQVRPTGPGQHSFGQVLQNKSAANAANPASQVNPLQKMDIQKTQKIPTALKSMFNTWSKDSNAMNKVMHVALSGQNFSPTQLIGLQQATYKISFELEAMSKLAEQASSAVKTTMQTQV